MGKWLFLFLFIGLLSSCHNTRQNNESDSLSKSSYINPILDRDFPDPAILKVKNGYYYAYATRNDVREEKANIQISRSSDLVRWTYLGDGLPERPVWSQKTMQFWAPHVIYDSMNNRYTMYYSAQHDSSKNKCLAIATARNPEGPFIDKGEPLKCGDSFINIDPMVFNDPKTKKKLLYWGSGHEPIKVQELSTDGLDFKKGSIMKKLIFPNVDQEYNGLIEGVWMHYREGYYYLFFSGDDCCSIREAHYAIMVARSKNAMGPFETLGEYKGSKNSVILEENEQWWDPGHNSVITDDQGNDWIIYHAIDPLNPYLIGENSERFVRRIMLLDRITYFNAWPHIANRSPSFTMQERPFIIGK